MKIKKYSGKSLTIIRKEIHEKFGSSAVIISARKNKLLRRHEVIVASNDNQKELKFDKNIAINFANEKLKKLLNNIHDAWSSQLLHNLNHNMFNNTANDEFKNSTKNIENRFYIQEVAHNLRDFIEIQNGIDFSILKNSNKKTNISVFVGATGVGKTTTLAKLAAKAVLQYNLNVGLITTDTYRVAAVDQLKEYAALLGLEMQIAFSGEELNRHLKNFESKDIVFIDTPGRSPYDKEGLNDIAEQLGISLQEQCNTFLVVPANIRREESKEIINSYNQLRPSALIISKTDECNNCDGLSTLLDYSKLPIAYISDGQSVPEDIHEANHNLITSLLLQNYTITNTDSIRIGVNGYE